MSLTERRTQLADWEVVREDLRDLDRLVSLSLRFSSRIEDNRLGLLKNQLMDVQIQGDVLLDSRFLKKPRLFLENGWTLEDIAERRIVLIEAIKTAYDSLPDTFKTPEIRKMRAGLYMPVRAQS